MTTLRPVARAMRASAGGSRPIVLGVGSTTVRPPGVLEQEDLVLGHLLVEEPEVVEVGVEVLADPAEVGQAHRLPRAPLVAGGRRLREHHLEIDQQVLVGQGDADRIRRDRAEHRLDLSGGWSRHPYRNAGAISAMNRSRSRRSSSMGRNMLGMNSVSTPADWSWWSCSRI